MSRSFERVRIDEHVVVQYLAVIRGDETHPAHIGGQGVDLLDTVGCLQAIRPATQVQNLEFVCRARRVVGQLEIHSANPVAPGAKKAHQVVADKPAGSRYENSRWHDAGLLTLSLAIGSLLVAHAAC